MFDKALEVMDKAFDSVFTSKKAPIIADTFHTVRIVLTEEQILKLTCGGTLIYKTPDFRVTLEKKKNA